VCCVVCCGASAAANACPLASTVRKLMLWFATFGSCFVKGLEQNVKDPVR
jgi:hypothetical protein